PNTTDYRLFYTRYLYRDYVIPRMQKYLTRSAQQAFGDDASELSEVPSDLPSHLPTELQVEPPEQEVQTPIDATARPSTTERTIDGSQRACFRVDWNLLSSKWVPRHPDKRSIGGPKVSWIWKHGMEIQKITEQRSPSNKYWLCQLCYEANKMKPQILQAASTTNAGKHMKLIHQVDEDGLIELEKITPSELSLEHYYRRLSPSNAEQMETELC
ncbi:hypothetical protein LTR16_003557, partial [Cryomyces antarcticus]